MPAEGLPSAATRPAVVNVQNCQVSTQFLRSPFSALVGPLPMEWIDVFHNCEAGILLHLGISISGARVAGRSMDAVLPTRYELVSPGPPKRYRDTCRDRAYCG